MTSWIVPELFIAVVCAVLNKASVIGGVWFFLYFITAIVCCMIYWFFPLRNWWDGILPSSYTFVFAVLMSDPNGWKEFTEGLHPSFILYPLLFGVIQLLVSSSMTHLRPRLINEVAVIQPTT